MTTKAAKPKTRKPRNRGGELPTAKGDNESTPRPAPADTRTGTMVTVLDNTVPGGVRYEHVPGHV
jgi:hypothetical protein